MVYRLNSIKAELDGDTIQYDNGESIWLVTYLAMYDWDNPSPEEPAANTFPIRNNVIDKVKIIFFI